MRHIKTTVKVFMLFFVFIIGTNTGNTQSNEDSYVGVKAPEFSLSDLEGNIVDSDVYRGKYLVIHIATTWCPFCNAEAPYLQQLYEDYKNKNVEVLIIDVKEPASLVKTKLQENFDLTFPILLDKDGKVAASFAPEDVLPDLARDEVMLASNILIDTNGNIRFLSLLDSKNFDPKLMDLKATLDALLDEE